MTNTSRVAIAPYKRGSRSAKLLRAGLSEALGRNVLFVSPERVGLCKSSRIVINWGSSGVDYEGGCRIINHPVSVSIAANKLQTLAAFNLYDIPHPQFTVDINTARDWLAEGNKVMCRTLLTAHSGQGIVVAKQQDELVDAPLYTKYIRKQKEFRVHVFNSKIIDIQEKRRSSSVDNHHPYIRNHTNGYVFCRGDIEEPNDLRGVAISAVNALGLDFGAVDVIWNEAQDKCYVLEVNTACGLEGSTVNKYVNAIKEVV
jgi:glutathione synthase/RimK-type ligase-like ATP-grasp enzyme